MIEVREFKDSEGKPKYKLYVDGLLIERVGISYDDDSDSFSGAIDITDDEESYIITSHAISEFPLVLNLGLRLKNDWLEVVDRIFIQKEDAAQGYSMTLAIMKTSNWHRPFSFRAYFDELRKIQNASGEQSIELSSTDESELFIDVFTMKSPCSTEQPIINEINRFFDTLRPLHDAAIHALTLASINNSITVSFDFPEDVKVPCEQYLLYFAQFLKDLGVQADTALTHEAGQVLFTVTPADKDQALDRIQQALEIYLKLPASKVTADDRDIVTQRLAANIYHLKSQLALSQAMLQTKDATIEAQQLTIDIQKSLLSGEIIFDSLKDVTPKPEDKENLLGGVIALATYKDKGIEVNLAELYRKLKRLFNDER